MDVPLVGDKRDAVVGERHLLYDGNQLEFSSSADRAGGSWRSATIRP